MSEGRFFYLCFLNIRSCAALLDCQAIAAKKSFCEMKFLYCFASVIEVSLSDISCLSRFAQKDFKITFAAWK